MSSIDADVNIILTAQDRASPTVEAATKRINSSWRQLQNSDKALQHAFELQHRTFTQSVRVIQSLSNIASRATGVFQSWQLLRIREEQIQQSLNDLYKQQRELIAGGNFEEAEEVQKRINEELEKQKGLLADNIQAWLLTVGVLTGPVLGGLKKAIPGLNRIFGKTTGAGATSTTTTKAVTPKIGTRLGGKLPGIGGTLGGIGASALFYLLQLMGEQQASAPTFNPATGQLETKELPGGLDLIKDLIFKTDSSKKIILNVKVENQTQSAEIDTTTGQITYGQ